MHKVSASETGENPLRKEQETSKICDKERPTTSMTTGEEAPQKKKQKSQKLADTFVSSPDGCEKNVCEEKRRKRRNEQSHNLADSFIASEHQQCRRVGEVWRCDEVAIPGRPYCEKHQFMRDNETVTKRPREQSLFHKDPFLPSSDQQCRRTGKGWRCHEKASPGKRYCHKHQQEQNANNEKKKKKRQERSCLVARGTKEGENTTIDHLLPITNKKLKIL